MGEVGEPASGAQTRETPREHWPKPQPSRGSQSRSMSGRGPNSVRVSQGAEAQCGAIRENRWLAFRPAWLTLRSAVVFVRSTIPKDPRSVADQTLRLRFPVDFGVTFVPVSRPSGPT